MSSAWWSWGGRGAGRRGAEELERRGAGPGRGDGAEANTWARTRTCSRRWGEAEPGPGRGDRARRSGRGYMALRRSCGRGDLGEGTWRGSAGRSDGGEEDDA